MRLMKAICIMAVVLCTVAVRANALKTPEGDIPICITVNGTFIRTDAEPFIAYDTTYVPVRFVGEALGADVQWDKNTKTAAIKNSEAEIILKENSTVAVVNGESKDMGRYAFIKDGRLFVPVRFVTETLGAAVNWDNDYFVVNIVKSGVTVPDEIKDTCSYDDITWLARIIHAESSGEPSIGQVAVGNVILNRVKSNEYPNTIYGVIFDNKFGVQFQPTVNGAIYNQPSQNCIVSAKRALKGENVVGDCLFFLNPKTSTNFWIANNRKFYTKIHNHDFYL